MKNLKKNSRARLNEIVGGDRFDLCDSFVSHDGENGQPCQCDLHCNSQKCGMDGKCEKTKQYP